MLKFEELKTKIEELGYYATDELLYDTFNALSIYSSGEIHPGQDIFAVCLEGPPGAGKTEFAKIYTKICNEIFNNTVEMVDYQCDAATGKTELIEDINITAVVSGETDKINIPGKLIEAINKVKEGKKVILFIDEYDKAREETDAFFLQFLQSGKINSIQHGDLEIEDKYKSNLQVIFCKNDMREELSGPLSRRIRIIRLDYMKPSTFYKVATRVLLEERIDKVDDGLLNLVTLMYEEAYKQKEKYNRLPSCSEMLIAIEDADRLLKLANAPKNIIYNCIIRNMFKSKDDITTFEQLGGKNNKLSELIKDMKKEQQNDNTEIDINNLIASRVLKKESDKLLSKAKQLDKLFNDYKNKLEEVSKKESTSNQTINLSDGKLVTINTPGVVSNFNDSTDTIKRGHDIFKISESDWTIIGNVVFNKLYFSKCTDELIKYAEKLGLVVYENGFLIADSGNGQKLILVNDGTQYIFMSNYQVIPSDYLLEIRTLLTVFNDILNSINISKTDANNAIYIINSLIYNDTTLNYQMVDENVYSMSLKENLNSPTNLDEILKSKKCDDLNKPIEKTKKLCMK